MDQLILTIDNLAKNVKQIAVPLAGLIVVIIGIMYMLSKDPNQKQQYTGWIINVAVGFALVYAGATLVTWFSNQVGGFA